MKDGVYCRIRRGAGIMGTGAVLSCLLSSCAVVDWFAGKTSDAEVKEMDKEVEQSVSARTTAYDSALKRFGQMLESYNISEIRVQSKLISNQTAEKELPDNVSRMLISAVNKIGKVVVYTPYDPSYVLNEANTGGEINRALPQIVLAGGITEFDKDMIEKSRELKGEASIQKGDYGSNYSHDGGAGYNAESGVSRITLDLQLMNYKSQTYLSGIQSINSVNIRKSKLGWGIGYFFQGSGMSFQYSLSQKQGKYYALRLLVELSVLEVMGKYFDVPYWKCIEGMGADQHMITRIRDEFGMLDDARQYAYLKEYLYFHGITGFDRDSAVMSAGELSRLQEVMAQQGCNNYTDLFVKLWENVPLEKARERNLEYRREMVRKQNQAQADTQGKIAQYNALLSHADQLFSAGRLEESREAYRQAGAIFPDQRDPADMVAKIDQQLAAAKSAPQPPSQQAAVAVAPAQEAVQPTAAPAPAPAQAQAQAAPASASAAKGREAPLNPFKSVEW